MDGGLVAVGELPVAPHCKLLRIRKDSFVPREDGTYDFKKGKEIRVSGAPGYCWTNLMSGTVEAVGDAAAGDADAGEGGEQAGAMDDTPTTQGKKRKKPKLSAEQTRAVLQAQTKPLDMSSVDEAYLQVFLKHFGGKDTDLAELPDKLHPEHSPLEAMADKQLPEGWVGIGDAAKAAAEAAKAAAEAAAKALADAADDEEKAAALAAQEAAAEKVKAAGLCPRKKFKKLLGELVPVNNVGTDLPQGATKAMHALAKKGRTASACRFGAVADSPCRRLGFAVCNLERLQAIAGGMGDEFKQHLECVDPERQQTLLLRAAVEQCWEVVAWLLEQGANPNASDPQGNTALCLACRGRGNWPAREAAAKVLLRDKRTEVNAADALLRAAVEQCWEVVAWLLEQGANPNASDPQGNTALRLACRGHGPWPAREAAAEALLRDKRTEVNAADAHGTTALHLAWRSENAALITKLLDKGADADAKDTEHGKPLSFSAEGLVAGYDEPIIKAFIATAKKMTRNEPCSKMGKQWPLDLLRASNFADQATKDRLDAELVKLGFEEQPKKATKPEARNAATPPLLEAVAVQEPAAVQEAATHGVAPLAPHPPQSALYADDATAANQP